MVHFKSRVVWEERPRAVCSGRGGARLELRRGGLRTAGREAVVVGFAAVEGLR